MIKTAINYFYDVCFSRVSLRFEAHFLSCVSLALVSLLKVLVRGSKVRFSVRYLSIFAIRLYFTVRSQVAKTKVLHCALSLASPLYRQLF